MDATRRSATVTVPGLPLAEARQTLMRAWPSLLAGVVSLGVVIGLAWSSGGYFPPAYLAAGAVTYGVLGLLLVARAPTFRLSTHALVAVGCLAALAAWTGISARWSPAPAAGLEAMQRTLLYAGLFGLGLVAAGSGRFARYLVWALLGVIVLVVGAGLVSRLYPELIPSGLTARDLGAYRLGYPLSYWNAYGAMAAIGAVLALGLAADPRAPVALRAGAAPAAVLLSTAMYLSLSRGAWLALAAGVAVLIALSAHRGSLLVTGLVVLPAVALAVARVHAYPALVDDPQRGAGQVAAGADFGPQLLLVLAAVAAAQGVVAATRSSDNWMRALRIVFRPLLLGLAGLFAVGALGAYLVKADAVDRHSAAALDDATGWVDRQWDDFMQPTGFAEEGSGRLSSAKSSRSDHYHVALDGLRAHPLRGDGAGGFEVRWMRERRVAVKVRNAHSLYHETAGELGLVGLALLAAFVACLVVAAVRSRLRPRALARSQAAAVAAACSVWLVHCAFDWDWQVPALTGTALLLAGTLFTYGKRSGEPA